jgi:hypothetical protein
MGLNRVRAPWLVVSKLGVTAILIKKTFVSKNALVICFHHICTKTFLSYTQQRALGI